MNMENLSALFENGAYTLVVQKGGVTVHKDFGRGVGRRCGYLTRSRSF